MIRSISIIASCLPITACAVAEDTNVRDVVKITVTGKLPDAKKLIWRGKMRLSGRKDLSSTTWSVFII